jgi:ABC-type nitrate/sulfonate/bicarbonate transport system permease component
MKLYPLLGPLLLLLTWFVLTSLGIVSPIILPNPLSVGGALVSLLVSERSLWPHIGLTVYRTLLSFTLAFMLGVPLGLFMGYIPVIYRTFEFLVDFFRSIPPIALFPLFLLVLGFGELSKLGVSFYGCSLVIIISSVYGVLNAPALRRTVGKVYGFSRWQIFWKIVLPDALPQVFVGMRTALSLALVLTMVVEMFFGSNNGLGKKIYDYHLLFDIPEMYAVIIITGAIGYLLNQGFLFLEKHIIHWADK